MGVMLAAAVLAIAIPLYRTEKKLTTTSGLTILGVTAVASLLYMQIGTPNIKSNPDSMPNINEMVATLALRLEGAPEDVNGWKMLGRSYLQLQNFGGAVEAYEKAVALEFGGNSQTLADLGEAVFLSDEISLSGRAGQLFEQAIAITPNNPKALFYSGMAAAQRGNNLLAAERWEALLATSPPTEIETILREQIEILREPGEVYVEPATGKPEISGITVDISLGDAAAQEKLQNAPIFIIARDPSQPSPPIAVVRRQLSQLPMRVSITDSDSMMPGRSISGFSEIEIVARISFTGSPMAQPGDWFGEQTIEMEDGQGVQIIINKKVQ